MNWYKILGIAVLAAIVLIATIKAVALLVKAAAFALVVLALLVPVAIGYGGYKLFKRKRV